MYVILEVNCGLGGESREGDVRGRAGDREVVREHREERAEARHVVRRRDGPP